MKKIPLTLALASFAIASVRADVVFNENFNYVDGSINLIGTNAPGVTNWFKHSGVPDDAFVSNMKLQVAMHRGADVNRPFYTGGSGAYTNSVTNIFASFTVNCTNLPTTSNYFAHFLIGTTTFHARAWNAPGSLPGTWRLGITTTTTTLGLIKYFPADLATNTDYQLVVNWDETQGANSIASIWVNPVSDVDSKVTASDAVAGAISTAYAFRQPTVGTAATAGSFNISNLVVATSFNEAATNVWATNAVAPAIVYSPVGGTNFVGNPVLLSGVASGQGLGSMTYTWLKNGGIYPNPDGNTNTLNFPSAVATDSGAYRLVATTPYGLSATSAVANLWVTNAAVPPAFTTQPSNTTVYFGQTATFYAAVTSPGTVSYQWKHFGTNLPGEVNPTLTVSNVQTNNGTTGPYSVGVTNDVTPNGVVSTNAELSAIPIPAVSIAYLRTLVDGNYLATNSTAVWQATGTVTTFTNLTTGNTSSYYLQDSTAGINIFATLASTFRPAQGDVVRFVGVLSSFNSTLELLADTANNPVASYTVLSNNIAGLPAPKVIPFSITNNLPQVEATEGSVVMLTNVFFGTNAGNIISTNANTTVTVTNAAGETFNVFFSSQDLDTAGQTLPSFAWTVRGVLAQNLGNAVSPRNQLYNVTVTRFADIVTTPPAAVSVSQTHSGNKSLLTWAADPYNASYTVLTSTSVGGPYAPQNTYQAALLGINEVPASANTTATGLGTVALSPDQSTITVNFRFSGLTAPANAGHIHGPAAAGVNAGVLFPFSGVPAATSGAIPEQSFAITPTQVGYLTNGQLYMNVHNANFPGGEIRGQILLVPSRGLTFPTVNGTYTDVNASSPAKFYQVVSP